MTSHLPKIWINREAVIVSKINLEWQVTKVLRENTNLLLYVLRQITEVGWRKEPFGKYEQKSKQIKYSVCKSTRVQSLIAKIWVIAAKV